jgi:hypothetical protein
MKNRQAAGGTTHTVSLAGQMLAISLLCGLLAGCGSGNEPGSLVPTSPSPQVVLTGRIAATNGGTALSGVAIDVGNQTVMSDENGAFRVEWNFIPGMTRMTLTSDRIVQRITTVNATSSRQVSVDAIALGNGFDLDFYRAFVRNTFTEPGNVQPLRRWTRAPMVYVKTVDEAGEPIDATTLDTVTTALNSVAQTWTGGRFALAGIERGTETRVGVSGWITVRWPNPSVDPNCGRAQVGMDGGWIELQHLRNCGCGGSRIRPYTVKHELGHALGYFHTGQAGDLMSGISVSLCDLEPSARERLHATIAYSRPVGNLDPDTDPSSTVALRSPQPIVVP